MKNQILGALPVRIFSLGLLLILLNKPSFTQNKPVLYASLVKSKGYVAGGKLSASGLYRFGGDSSWTHIGWNNPRVYGMAFDRTHPNIIFLACGNGVLRTRDGGQSWRITTGWEVTEALDVAVDPILPRNVYLATAYGIWRSKDQGQTWMESSNGLAKKYTPTIEVDRTRSKRVLAGTEGGLYMSNDGARSWFLVGPKDVTVLDIQQSGTEPGLWLAGTQQDGVLLSGDGGQTWLKARDGVSKASIYAVAIDPFNAQNQAAAGWDTGVFVSQDGGKHWQRLPEGLPTPHIYELIFDVSQSGEIWAATVEEGIFKSNDFGRSWQYRGMHGALVFDMAFVFRE